MLVLPLYPKNAKVSLDDIDVCTKDHAVSLDVSGGQGSARCKFIGWNTCLPGHLVLDHVISYDLCLFLLSGKVFCLDTPPPFFDHIEGHLCSAGMQ